MFKSLLHYLQARLRAVFGDYRGFFRHLIKWTALGSLVGILCGSASALFLHVLDLVTRLRLERPALIVFLPLAGLGIGWVYHRYGGAAARGSNLIIDELHTNASRIPFRMFSLILIGTWVSHLFGGSAGREGTAIQMGTSLADNLRRLLGLNRADRRLMIMAGVSGGFGSVFGTPVAGVVFGMEFQSAGRMRYDGIVPCLVSACVGDLVTRAWGIRHSHYAPFPDFPIDAGLLIKVVLAGIAFGLAGLLFIEFTHLVKWGFGRLPVAPYIRPVIGGVLVIGLTVLVGTTDYNGLSIPFITRSLDGTGVPPEVWILKLVFTGLTLGSGFVGGEVTPLFLIGAALGYTLGGPLGVPPTFLAALGFTAVFAGASNTPIACTVLAVEIFGGGGEVYVLVANVIAYLSSGNRSIYTAQRIGVAITNHHARADETMADLESRYHQQS
jgi:H+/Cl- antiporter ClcA